MLRYWPLVAMILLVGCKKSAPLKTVAAPPLPQGWTLAADAESKVSIAIPAGWRVGVMPTPPSSNDFGGDSQQGQASVDAMMSGLGKMSQEQEQKTLAQLRKKGIVLHCVDGSRQTIGEEPTRICVTQIDAPTLEAAVSQVRASMTNEGQGEVFNSPVGKAWTLTFASTNAPEVFDAIHREVANSFRRG